MTARRSAATDDGFTLIELLVSVAILGLILLPVSNAFIGVLRNVDATSARMVASHSAQLSATYFAQDVAGVGVHDYTASGAPMATSVLTSGDAGSTCGDGGTGATVRFLSDAYDNTVSPPALHRAVVSWAVVTVAGDNQMVRSRCVDGSLVSQLTLAQNVVGSPAVTCSSTCDALPLPQTVRLSFSVAPPSAALYAISLTGDRRQT
ncbi:prepilin-type N-terminal cleavage/methylation domain-containing protein [Nakamurella panacisegetis]|uniref:Prepilin-type N-terminal cleavage/methylation domain-containing protein n=1 Tax=Nakamurella panacisegetis TaxID=1090615 RepID=A0A1H0R8N7_9ACTN|nr:prepilin-type N-terminal cleavage/methylation domain-containing protein [Nakamurella panacisegetis]SDP25426.1 prepilin-type N-terminal cleavage/methylation domain-containing protein [Nakamurella panacisegetis]